MSARASRYPLPPGSHSRRPPSGLNATEHKSLARLAAAVTRDLGIRMPVAKLTMLHGRVLRRMRALSLASVEEYERHLLGTSGAHELAHFYDAVTTNKTEFFREPKHFGYLTKSALPALRARHSEGSRWHCRLWCAGCSSGQEAYTLAIVLAEYAQQTPGFSFSIMATDISARVLREASLGIYDEALVEPVPAELRRRYLLRSKDKSRRLVRVAPELREQVRFGRLNFMDERYPLKGPFDVIFFRNVMIYFDRPTQQQVLTRQCALLRPQGYLFTSHTETLAGLTLPLETVSDAVYRRLP